VAPVNKTIIRRATVINGNILMNVLSVAGGKKNRCRAPKIRFIVMSLLSI